MQEQNVVNIFAAAFDNCESSLFQASSTKCSIFLKDTYAACAFAVRVVLVVVARLTLAAAGTVVVVIVVETTTLVDVEVPVDVDVTVTVEVLGLYRAAQRALTFAFDFNDAKSA